MIVNVDSITLVGLIIRGYAPQEIKVFRNRSQLECD